MRYGTKLIDLVRNKAYIRMDGYYALYHSHRMHPDPRMPSRALYWKTRGLIAFDRMVCGQAPIKDYVC